MIVRIVITARTDEYYVLRRCYDVLILLKKCAEVLEFFVFVFFFKDPVVNEFLLCSPMKISQFQY